MVCNYKLEGNGHFMGLENVVITVMQGDKRLERFVANYPNIRTLRGFLAGEWDLSLFDNCFKGSNRLGDIDASIELNSYTLHVEFKGAKGGMNKGQVLKALRQAKYTGIVTLFVFGKRNSPDAYLMIEPEDSEKGFKSSGYIKGNLEDVQNVILEWAKWTEENTRVESKTSEWQQVSEILSSVYGAE